MAIAQQQGPRIAPLVLATSGSARALALGDAYIVLGSDPDVIFYNPAQLVSARGVAVGMQRWTGASSLVTLSGASALAPGAIAVGAQLLDHRAADGSYHALSRSGVDALFDRGSTVATGVVASIAYARPAMFSTRVGVTAKVLHQQFGNETDVTGAFDVGVARGSGVQLTVVGRNLGHGVRLGGPTVPLPREVAVGAAVPRREVGPLDLAATSSLGLLADGRLVGGAGVELGYMPLDGFTFALRGGYRRFEQGAEHISYGAGFVGERVSIDYGVHGIDIDRMSHRVGLRWR